jgi:nitrate/nitrite transporter NarK
VTAVLWTAGVNVIGRSFEAERQATAVGVFSAAPAAGFALGLVTGPLVATTFGWAAVFLAYAGPAVAGSLAYWLVSPGVGTVGGGSDRAELADLRRLLGRRTVWNVALLAFLGFSLYAFVTSWVPSYLSDVLGVSLAGSGLLAALFPAVGALARGGSGAVSDRLFGHRRRPVVLLAFAVSAPAVLLIVLTRTVAVIFLALVLAGLFLQMGVGLVYSLAHEIADPTVAATGVAVTTSMATFGGFTAPLIGGLLIEGSGYPAAFGYAVVAGVVGLALAWFTPEPGGPG